jgi:hypothetical protein
MEDEKMTQERAVGIERAMVEWKQRKAFVVQVSWRAIHPYMLIRNDPRQELMYLG